MPDAPWQCSECGTINEPAANACRTCGRWPSMFDLEESKLEDLPPINPQAPAPTIELGPEPIPADEPPPEVEDQNEPDEPVASSGPPWRRLLRFAVPVGIALYILISSALNR